MSSLAALVSLCRFSKCDATIQNNRTVPNNMKNRPIPNPDVVDLESTLTPPDVSKPLPQELLPTDFRSVLVRLAQKYGAGLQVNVTDAEWVEISVENLSAADLQTQLHSERSVLFGAVESRLQVISPSQVDSNIIYLHLLNQPRWGEISTMALRAKK